MQVTESGLIVVRFWRLVDLILTQVAVSFVVRILTQVTGCENISDRLLL